MKGSIMTENSHDGHIVNPNKGDGSTSDPNWHGDAGDQGNDLRFAEEQALINEQAEGGPAEAEDAVEQEGHYTSAEPTGGSGGYTSAENPAEEGEYTDKDRPLIDKPHGEGEYTDRDR
ncbi:hypothetical protein [Arthrobacter sp. L77]|uniref:hypothetical protein n=1 Tax=Arthrobacter sp. L77 TaxID=1496689 RepID=UPI0005BD42B7|nr:hypothetical protein [Arthrobacter sp. L77]